MVLYGDAEGFDFFKNLKQQLDMVLASYHVHYYFLAENPGGGDMPPKPFYFLSTYFQNRRSAAQQQSVHFLNDLDVRSSIYHMMNADMLVCTGSSFPYLAATASPKVSAACLPAASGAPSRSNWHVIQCARAWLLGQME